MPPTLAEVEVMASQLDEFDRAVLRDHLTTGGQPSTEMPDTSADAAVENLQRVMDRITVAPLSGTEMLSLDRESRAWSLSMLASGLAPPLQESGPTR